MEARVARMEAQTRALLERMDARSKALEERMQEQMENDKSRLFGIFERWTHDINPLIKGKGVTNVGEALLTETPRISPNHVIPSSLTLKQSSTTNFVKDDP